MKTEIHFPSEKNCRVVSNVRKGRPPPPPPPSPPPPPPPARRRQAKTYLALGEVLACALRVVELESVAALGALVERPVGDLVDLVAGVEAEVRHVGRLLATAASLLLRNCELGALHACDFEASLGEHELEAFHGRAVELVAVKEHGPEDAQHGVLLLRHGFAPGGLWTDWTNGSFDRQARESPPIAPYLALNHQKGESCADRPDLYSGPITSCTVVYIK